MRPVTERRGPAVVALGGGHGLAAALRAARRYAGTITAVVSMADDGGSSGRLRRDLDMPPPGDVRTCLVALAREAGWAEVVEHRFEGGALDGHALGNLMLAGLTATLDDFGRAVTALATLLDAEGTVVPATTEPVVLTADVDGQQVEGQVAVSRSAGRVRRVGIVPKDARAHGQAIQALAEADQVVLAPGSLFTSLLPVLCVEELRAAVDASPGRVVQVCNLGPQVPETEGLTGNDHLDAVLDHGLARVDAFVYQRDGRLAVDDDAVRSRGSEPVAADVADPRGLAHDPDALATVLGCLLGPTAT